MVGMRKVHFSPWLIQSVSTVELLTPASVNNCGNDFLPLFNCLFFCRRNKANKHVYQNKSSFHWLRPIHYILIRFSRQIAMNQRILYTIKYSWNVPYLMNSKEIHTSCIFQFFNPLNADLNPICHLLALLGAQRILHVSRIRVKLYFTVGWEVVFWWVWVIYDTKKCTPKQHNALWKIDRQLFYIKVL